jgi:hypothetical protein
MTSYHGQTDDEAPFRIRAFRLKRGLPDIGESMRETHFALIPSCRECGTPGCVCPPLRTIPMLCGDPYDHSLLDEVFSSRDAGIPHAVCLRAVTPLLRERPVAKQADVAQTSTAEMVVEGTVVASRDVRLTSSLLVSTSGGDRHSGW